MCQRAFEVAQTIFIPIGWRARVQGQPNTTDTTAMGRSRHRDCENWSWLYLPSPTRGGGARPALSSFFWVRGPLARSEKSLGTGFYMFRDSCGIPFRTGFLLEMIPRKPLKLTEGVLENRALHQSESSISVRWVAENLCDPSLNHGMVDGSWGFG